MKYLASCFLLLLLSAASAMAMASPATNGAARVRVVTLNLYHDKDDWPKRRVQILEKLKELQPDVIALQEVLQHETLQNQASWLASALGYQWHFVSTDPAGKPLRYGNAILTRHPVARRGQKLLHPLDDSRTAGFVRIDLDGRPLNVYVTHLHWTEAGGAIRKQQVADLMQYIDETSAGVPSLVAGDFNTVADAPELAALRRDFVDTYGILHPAADTTLSSTLNLAYFTPKRIDHVFFQRNQFEPLVSEIIFKHPDAAGTWASDHFGVYAELRFSGYGP